MRSTLRKAAGWSAVLSLAWGAGAYANTNVDADTGMDADTGSAVLSMGQVQCLRSHSVQLARLASCGHAGSLNYCLHHRLLMSDEEEVAEENTTAFSSDMAALETCFVNAGCTAAEARIEAEWTAKQCELADRYNGGSLDELRRRQPADSNDSTTTASKTETTTSDKKKTTATTAATSTEDTKTTTAESTTTTATTTASTTATTSTSTSSSTSSETSLVCLTTQTTSTTTCPVQSTGSQSGKTMSCFPTTAVASACAPGMLCTTSASVVNCLKKESIGVAGIIIASVFATAVAVVTFAICFSCCRDRREEARLLKAAEAAALVKQTAMVSDPKQSSRVAVQGFAVGSSAAAAAVAAEASSDTQPLMFYQAPEPAMASTQSVPHSMTGSDVAGPNPFDQHQYH